MLKRLGTLALDLLLPPHCLTCEAEVLTADRFCAECHRLIQRPGSLACESCGLPLARGAGARCAGCLADPPPWGRGRAAMVYDAQSRRVILPFKNADRPELARALAAMMAQAAGPLLHDADLIVPVPLHRARLFARRYNQSALLAQALGRLAERQAVPDALRRLRATAPLGDKPAAARAAELAGAIAVRPARAALVAGARVLLVDDVLTSGATCRACTQALLAAGALGVDVLVAARVPPRGSLLHGEAADPTHRDNEGRA